MITCNRIALTTLVFLSSSIAFAEPACNTCCEKLGGIQYCDSSAGRYVCTNGDYSTCYCTRHAIMDLQKIAGCCLWQGGLFKISDEGLVICNNGSVSELCSLQRLKGSREP